MIQDIGKPQFIVDERGNRTAVILQLDEYRRLLDSQEELDDIRAFDEAESEGGDYLPFEQVVREIEEGRE